MYMDQFYGKFIVMCNWFSCFIFSKRIYEIYNKTIWFIMPFCYSNIILMFRHVYIDHKCQKSQIKKGSSMNIGKIKQKLSTQELVYIPTFNICASISSMKYFNYFVVSYISMYIVFRSTPRTRVRLNCQGRRIQAATTRCTKWK